MQAGDVVGALDSLANLEKLTRLGSDMKSNARIVVAMVRACHENSKWDLLNDTVLSLSKKRLIIKYAIAKMVADCCAVVEKMKVCLYTYGTNIYFTSVFWAENVP